MLQIMGVWLMNRFFNYLRKPVSALLAVAMVLTILGSGYFSRPVQADNTDVTQVNAVFTWEDDNNDLQLRPDQSVVTLYCDGAVAVDANGNPIKLTADASNNWSVSFANLAAGHVYSVMNDGAAIAEDYYEENIINDLNGAALTYHFTETRKAGTPHTITISWKDLGNKYGVRPASVTVGSNYRPSFTMTSADASAEDPSVWTKTVNVKYHYGNDEAIYYYILAADNTELSPEYHSYNASISLSDKAEVYAQDHKNSGSYKSSYTLVPQLNTITLKASTSWEDGKNSQQTRPSGFHYIVMKNGEEWTDYMSDGIQTTSAGTSQKFEIPLKNADGTQNQVGDFTIVQSDIRPETYDCQGSSGNGSFTFTNTLKTTQHRAEVVWDDDGKVDSRPKTVTLQLYANGVPYSGEGGQVSLSTGDDSTSYTWEGLAAADSLGQPVKYTVKESGASGYEVTTADGDDTTNITNKKNGNWTSSLSLQWKTSAVGEGMGESVSDTERYNISQVVMDSQFRRVTYELHFSSSKIDCPAGTVSIRVPYYLMQNDDGTWLKPSSIPLPKAPDTNADYSFNYTIDDHGNDDPSDDEIVFTNWTTYKAGSNLLIPISYDVYPQNTTDNIVHSVMAKAEISETGESLETAPITYRMDTGLRINGASKDGSRRTKIYNSSSDDFWQAVDGTGKSIQSEGFEPDYAHYNYVAWNITGSGTANQDHIVTYTDTFGDKGKLIAYHSYYTNFHVKSVTDNGNGTTTAVFESEEVNMESGGSDGGSNKLFDSAAGSAGTVMILVQYPREEGQTSFKYTNHLMMNADGTDPEGYMPDLNDHATKTADAVCDWKEYAWKPTGDLYDFSKKSTTKDKKDKPDDYVTLLENGVDPVIKGHLYETLNGMYFGVSKEAMSKNTYQYSTDIIDRDLYWNITGADEQTNQYIPMTDEDYTFTKVTINVTNHDIDRDTGETAFPDYDSSKPLNFTLQGWYDGDWHDLRSFNLLNYRNSDNYYNTYVKGNPVISIAQDNVTGIRLKAPEGLKGQLSIALDYEIKLKSSSPTFKKWVEDKKAQGEHLERVYFLNNAGVKINRCSEDGSYYWWNPAYAGQNPQAEILPSADSSEEKPQTLAQQDVAQEGSRIMRYTAYESQGTVGYRDLIHKSVTSFAVDNNLSTLTATFAINAEGQCSTMQLPSAAYENSCFNAGVFYDLLPMGYRYVEETAGASGVAGKTAQVTNVETVENYKGTGRQLVIFHVKVDDENHNYSKWHTPGWDYHWGEQGGYNTGFRLTYDAVITWHELIYNPTSHNEVAYYSEDETRPLTYGDTDAKGYTVWSDKNLKDEDGNNVFIDINEDGDTTSKQVLYTNSVVTPVFVPPMETGISKLVRADSGVYQDLDITHPDGSYYYRIGFTTSEGETSNLVFYDILENGENIREGEGENVQYVDKTPQWKGTFESIKATVPSSVKAKPVIWYSTSKDLTYKAMQEA